MKYLIALICPPLALLLVHRPLRALVATFLLVVAILLWSTGLGAVLVAGVILWATRVVGSVAADEELAGFFRLINSPNPPKP